jgi:acetyl esterase
VNPVFWVLAQLGSRVTSKPPAEVEDPPLRLPGPQSVSVPTRHGPVPVLVQRPTASPPGGRGLPAPPVVVHLHGGGFVNRNPAQDLHIARHLAAHLGAVVLLPDYATAPRVRYPVAEEQVFDLYRWVVDHGHTNGWDGGRTAISGVSAGAKLAISTCQQLREAGLPRPAALALVVPVTDVVRTDRTSDIPRPAISPFVQRFVGWAYFPDVARRREPLASPRLDPHLPTAMPPTLVLTAEHDTLAGEGAELVGVLRAGGVEVAHHCYPGADHGFVAERPVERVRDALQRTSHFLQHHVGGSVRVVVDDQERP